MSIGDLKYTARNIQFSARRRLNSASSEIDDGIASDDTKSEVRIPYGREICNRTYRCPAGLDVNGQPVVGHWRAVMLEIVDRRIAGNDHAFDHSSIDVLVNPGPHVGGGKKRPDAFERRHGHARSGDAERNVRLGSSVIQISGQSDADIVRGASVDTAQIALLNFDTFAGGINTGANVDAINRYPLIFRGGARCKYHRIDHGIAPGHGQQPGIALIGRHLQDSAHGELIAARLDLKWDDEAVPPGVPVEAKIRVIDVQIDPVELLIDHASFVDEKLALHEPRRPFRCDFRADTRRQGQIDIKIPHVRAHGEQYVAC